jgi:hypothetical protein
MPASPLGRGELKMPLISFSTGARSLQKALTFLAEPRNTPKTTELWFSCGDPSPPFAGLERFLFLILLLIEKETSDPVEGELFS